jgi:hypothetical protein
MESEEEWKRQVSCCEAFVFVLWRQATPSSPTIYAKRTHANTHVRYHHMQRAFMHVRGVSGRECVLSEILGGLGFASYV